MRAVGRALDDATMNQKKADAQAKTLRRYLAAQAAFERAAQGLQFLQTNPFTEGDWNYATMFCGICVTYVAPFMSSSGLGPQPQVMQEFWKGTDLAFIHSAVYRARSSLFAHHSPDEIVDMVAGEVPEGDLGIRIEVLGLQRYRIQHRVPLWAKDRLGAFEQLCHYQVARVQKLAAPIFQNIEAAHGGPYANGIYTLGKDYP
jgi:hypothetical protein